MLRLPAAHPKRLGVLLAAFAAVLFMPLAIPAQVHGPRLVSERTPDLYDLDSFVLWNDINVLNEGVRSFTLSFHDLGGASLGTTGTLTSVSQFAPQTYSFAATVAGVKTVHMDVVTSSLQIEIREVAFNGNISAVPEPATAATLLAGLAGLAAWRRRRA